MAPEGVKGTKRKGAADAAPKPKPKKQKKVDEAALATKKSAKALNAAVKPIDDVQVNVKVSRKRAADLFDDGASAQDKPAKEKKAKKSKTVTDADGSKTKATVIVEDVTEPKAKKEKNARVLTEAQKEEKLAKMSDEKKEQKKADHSKRLKARKEQAAIENAEEDDEDDQTAALLAGFESDNDEDDPAEDAELDIETDITADIDPKTRDALEKAEKASKNTNEPGVIYVGRIPHGFYESQMRGYFKQFGRVTRLRVSRNKKTGAAKHYAFVEFQSAEVADIVARTMNNYLMFGHILQCRVIPTAQVNPKLFDGANTRFKIDPRNKKEGAAMEHGAERAVWEKRINNAQKKRALRNKGLQDEMDYEFTGPAMKVVADVPKNVSAATLDDGAAQQLLAEASAADTADAVQSESKPEHSSVPETTVKAKAKKPRKPTKATVDAPVEKTDADADAGSKAVTEKAEDVVKVAADVLSGVQPKKTKKGPKAKKNIQAPAEGILENIEAAAKSGAETIVDAASAAVDKVESVIDAAVEAIVPEIEETVPEIKTKKPRNRKAKANGTAIAEPVVEEVDPAKVVVDEVEEKAEVVQEKKVKGKKAKKAKIATEAIAEQIEQAAAVPEAVVEAEPVKEKKAKKAKKAKVDAVPEVQGEAPVQSIVGDVIDAAKKTTKKVKAAKKAKPELVVEADEAPVQSVVGDIVDKAEVSTKKVKKAKKAKASVA